jgi:two-component sensor histidine kinase
MPDPVRVLYIDDDPGLGRLMQRSLFASGFLIHHVETGGEGLALLETERFDAVALDHELKGETGLDLIHKIVSLPDAPLVVYVTGTDDSRVAVAALKAGAVDYVLKDVQGHYRELLGQVLTSALAQAKLRREKEEADRLVREARDRAELLLKEVNHRVANSLFLVASLARMQAKSVTDETARSVLQEMEVRIAAIAGIHRRLYTSTDVRFVELDAYLQNLVEELSTAMSADQKKHAIRLESSLGVQMSTDRAVSLGMIVAELVTNAYKYAYPSNVRGDIRVLLRRVAEDRLSLIVEDDGVGWSGSGEVQGSGLGSRIIAAMAQKLQSAVTYDSQYAGTRAELQFVV